MLGVLPLSGVVSPFLSSGNTAMLANFLVFALLLSISADDRGEVRTSCRTASAPLKLVLAAAALVLRRHGRALPGASRIATTWRATRTPSKTTASSARSTIRA